MGDEKNRAEASRWLETARGDLQTARVLVDNRRFAHSCFHAQQSAEKALKALWFSLDGDPWGHSSRKLIDDLQSLDSHTYDAMQDLLPVATELDRFYIPTRYPNGLPDIVPDQAYLERDAQRAIVLAERLVERVAARISPA